MADTKRTHAKDQQKVAPPPTSGPYAYGRPSAPNPAAKQAPAPDDHPEQQVPPAVKKELAKDMKAAKAAPPGPKAEPAPLDIGTAHNQRTTLPAGHSRDGDPAATNEVIEAQNREKAAKTSPDNAPG